MKNTPFSVQIDGLSPRFRKEALKALIGLIIFFALIIFLVEVFT